MRKLFAEHEPADLTANLTFLDNSRSVALPQIAPAVYMMGVVSKAANYQRPHLTRLARHCYTENAPSNHRPDAFAGEDLQMERRPKPTRAKRLRVTH